MTVGAKSRVMPWIDLVWARYLCRCPDIAARREARKSRKLQIGREKWKEKKQQAKEAKRLKKLKKRRATELSTDIAVKKVAVPRKKIEVCLPSIC